MSRQSRRSALTAKWAAALLTEERKVVTVALVRRFTILRSELQSPGSLLLSGRLLGLATVVGAGILVLAACGGLSAAQKAEARKVEATRLAQATRQEEQRLAQEAAETRYQACNVNIGGLVEALENLDSRLDVGLTFSDYSTKVGDVQVAYDAMSREGLSDDFTCLRAAVSAESALNKFNSAYNIWNECISDINCSTDSIDSELQPKWSQASAAVDRARTRLDGLQTPEPVEEWSNDVPRTQSDVESTVYGAAKKVYCDEKDMKPAVVEPCVKLREVLKGGVSEDEIDDLDEVIVALNIALGLREAKS